MTERPQGTEPFRLAIEAAPIGFVVVDASGRIVLVNAQAERLFGYGREELLDRPVDMLVPERFRPPQPGLRGGILPGAAQCAEGSGRDLFALRKDGTEVPIEIQLNPVETAEGRFVIGSVVDVSERRRNEREREDLLNELRTLNAELERRVEGRTAELLATLREREVLLQEVHHRVKNNLQVISSLINMQLRSLGNDASRTALLDCRARVQAIALIHEKLYQSSNYAEVPFSAYARGLAADVFHAAGVSPGKVSLRLEVEDVALAVDKAIPCGLILNELMTNALKHAFPNGRPGTIRVELARAEHGGLRLAVADNGVGLAPGVDIRDSASLGLQLVTMLARQVDGDLEVDTAQGTRFRLTVPEAR
jgi:two-component system, sensor histidine kinase PdtaS